jgi:two-component system response regulator FixJ
MTITLIDDDAAVLRSLRLLLAGSGFEVSCFDSATAFLDQLERVPACIVSDVRMPGLSGQDLQSELRRRNLSVPLILITGHGDIDMAVNAIREGAFDFLEKPFDEERLLASISSAIERGEKLRNESLQRSEIGRRLMELSPRQREVIDLVVQGLANKEIALRLNISPRTVENYRAWAMEKMGASGLADLIRKMLMVKEGRQ